MTTPSMIENINKAAHLDVLWCTRFDHNIGPVLHAPSDDHLLGNSVSLLANLPDDRVLQAKEFSTKLQLPPIC